ncbi:MAG: NAD(+)/NADH kinase [Rikenellaceae bacterium]
MEIFLFSRAEKQHQVDELKHLFEMLLKFNFAFSLNREFAVLVSEMIGMSFSRAQIYDSLASCDFGADDIVLSYGGDGTFLQGVSMLEGKSTPILGINSGRLGFLANIPQKNIEQAFEDLIKGRFSIEQRDMLQVSGAFSSGQLSDLYAFNEFSVQRAGAGMIAVEAFINNEMIAKYWGDGVLLSTPSGSTAYSLSVGGPIVAPECDCFVLSPIAPHNLTMRPVVLPNSAEVVFKVSSRDKKIFASIDNSTFEMSSESEFLIKKSQKSIFIVVMQNISFYDTLRNKMMWGLDKRDELAN